MGFLMDLVAGESRAVLVAIATEDWPALADRSRFVAHLALGGAIDPTALDLFSQAIREVTDSDEPSDFLDARREIDGTGEIVSRTVERIDPGWISAVARVQDGKIDAIAGRWIDLIEDELGDLPREEKPWIRSVAAEIVRFARAADLSPAVILAWSL